MNQKGFTLIELCMVICLIGVLSLVAIPQYYNLIEDANVAAEQGVVGGVRSGIYTYMANQVVSCDEDACENPYPVQLDTLPAGTVCSVLNPCFTTVLAQGGVTSQWRKSITSARYKNIYSGNVYRYDSDTGNFIQVL